MRGVRDIRTGEEHGERECYIKRLFRSPSMASSPNRAPLHNSQCASLLFWARWGRGSFVSSKVCLLLPLVKVGEGLICIIQCVSLSTLGGGGGGAHLHQPQWAFVYLGVRWGRDSFASVIMCLPCVSSLGRGGGGAHCIAKVRLPLPMELFTIYSMWILDFPENFQN